MVFVAGEMQRRGFSIPLLIGGATTSRTHTAVKIEPAYRRGSTTYVTDASRAVGVVSGLLSPTERREGAGRDARRIRPHPRAVRPRPGGQGPHAAGRGARQPRSPSTGRPTRRRKPSFLGARAFGALRPRRPGPLHRLDAVLRQPGSWSAAIPAILEDDVVGEAARDLYADAQAMLKRIVAESWFEARGVVGLWPANADGDDIVVWTDETRTTELRPAPHPAPADGQGRGPANLALADFVAPIGQAPTRSAPSRSPPAMASRRSPSGSRPPATTIPPSWPPPWPTAWPRPSPRPCTARCAPSSGAMRPTSRSTSSPDRRALPRHPPRARLSGPARPYREGDAVRPAGRRGGRRDRPDRKLRHEPAGLGLRALFRPPAEPLFRRRQDRARPGRRLRPPQGLGPPDQPSAGSRRSSPMTQARPERSPSVGRARR